MTRSTITKRLIFLLFPLLSACTVLSSGAPGGAAEHFLQQVYFATTRKVEPASISGAYFSTERGELQFGSVAVRMNPADAMSPLAAPGEGALMVSAEDFAAEGLSDLRNLTRAEFLDLLAVRIAAHQDQSALVYVHGYKRSFEQSIVTTASLGFELAFPGALVTFSWPSTESVAGYVADLNNLEWSTPYLRRFLAELNQRSGAATIHLVAHSMGNRALISALLGLMAERDSARSWRFGDIVLLAPDLDRALFVDEIAPRLARLPSRLSLYVSADDLPLLAAGRLNAYPRLGDARGGVPVIPGIETIDVSDAITVTSGHGYYEESGLVTSDLHYLLSRGRGASQRPTLLPKDVGHGRYWSLRAEGVCDSPASATPNETRCQE